MEGQELDGYNADMHLGFEYQGKQHDERVEFFQRDDGAFESQLRRDAAKVAKCSELGIRLLVVSHKIKYCNLRDSVRAMLAEMGMTLGPIQCSSQELYDRVRVESTRANIQYNRAKEIAEYKGGRLLSPAYVGYKVPMEIMCKVGHVFHATLEDISRTGNTPRFCTKCAGNEPLTQNDFIAACKNRGYTFVKCTRTIDVTNGKKKRWMINTVCPAGHPWTVESYNFCRENEPRNCPLCNTHGRTKRGKKVDDWCAENAISIVGTYINNTTPHVWVCSQDHTFTLRYDALRNREAACIACRLGQCEDTYGIELITPWQNDFDVNTMMDWKCNKCDSTSKLSVMSIGRKLSSPKNKKRAAPILCKECDKKDLAAQPKPPRKPRKKKEYTVVLLAAPKDPDEPTSLQ
jgi:hypothetical protein